VPIAAFAVRAFERRADRPSDDRYGASIRVKTNLADVLRRELSRPRWAHETVVIGAATDPYQPAEGRYRLTRRSIEALAEARNPLSIITRGPLIVRDVDVLVEAARRAAVSVTFSIPTLDPAIVATTESGRRPRQRLSARTLVDAGSRASMAPIPACPSAGAPGRRRRRARAGATSIWTNVSCAPGHGAFLAQS
jgi:DNA repair photolyase